MTDGFGLSVAAVFGLLFGSFANVLILRDNALATVLTGRSMCPHCKHELAWFNLIPVLSYLWQRGRCGYCKKQISLQYPIVELSMAALAVLAFIVAKGALLPTALIAASLFFFLVIAVIDIRTQMMRVEYAIAAGVFGFLGQMLGGAEIGSLAIGALSAALIILMVRWGWYLLHKVHGMGDGDVFIAAAVGALVGWPQSLVMIFCAALLGSIGGGVVLMKQKSLLGARIAFGPFLFLGGVVALLWGQMLIDWYTEWSGIAYLFS